MNPTTIKLVCDQLAEELTGRRIGKLFQLSRNEIAVDLRLQESRYLYLNFSPADPRLYLITRRLKDLERSSRDLDAFGQSVRGRVSGGTISAVRAEPEERIFDFDIKTEGDLGAIEIIRLVVQLTGRSANFFITDDLGIILERARRTDGEGQQVGDVFKPPTRTTAPKHLEAKADTAVAISPGEPSATLDRFYTELAAEQRFNELARSALKKIDDEINRRRKLLEKLHADLKGHGDAEEWKKLGDVLLANISTARHEN